MEAEGDGGNGGWGIDEAPYLRNPVCITGGSCTLQLIAVSYKNTASIYLMYVWSTAELVFVLYSGWSASMWMVSLEPCTATWKLTLHSHDSHHVTVPPQISYTKLCHRWLLTYLQFIIQRYRLTNGCSHWCTLHADLKHFALYDLVLYIDGNYSFLSFWIVRRSYNCILYQPFYL